MSTDYVFGAVVEFFPTTQRLGANATPDALSVEIYDGVTARGTQNGITVTIDAYGVGLHRVLIDTAVNTGAAWSWATAKNYVAQMTAEWNDESEDVTKPYPFSIKNRPVTEIAAGAVTAAAIATGAIDADALAADAVAKLQSGLSTLTAAQVLSAYNAEVIQTAAKAGRDVTRGHLERLILSGLPFGVTSDTGTVVTHKTPAGGDTLGSVTVDGDGNRTAVTIAADPGA